MVPVVQTTDVSLRMADALSASAKDMEASASAVSVAVPVVRPKPSATEVKTDKNNVKSVVFKPPSAHPMSTAHQGVKSPFAAPWIEKTETAKTPRERADAEYRKSIIAVNQWRSDEALSICKSLCNRTGSMLQCVSCRLGCCLKTNDRMKPCSCLSVAWMSSRHRSAGR